MEALRLVAPDNKYQNQYIDFIRVCGEDIQKCGMYHYIPLSNESTFLDDIKGLIETGRGIGLPAGWVAASTYWLITEDNSA